MGWSTYFAFIFAAVNTLTVTYFLAIERYPFLTTIFPSFLQYIVIQLYKFSLTDSCPETHKYKITALCTAAIGTLVRLDGESHPYGSWKDMKYFLNYLTVFYENFQFYYMKSL